MTDNKEYTRVFEPDKEALAKLLAECKGEQRTMAQFAGAVGVSAPTLSRISNGNIIKPLSEDILKSIYANRDLSCTVELDDLYRANGLVPKEERDRMAHGVETRRLAQSLRDIAQQTIINELLYKGHTIKADISRGLGGRLSFSKFRNEEASDNLYFSFDLAITLPEFHDLSEWLFLIMLPPMQNSSMGFRSLEQEARFQVRRSLQIKNNVFLIDAWQPERFAGIKFSWVFLDKYSYNAFKEFAKSAKLNTAMSMILIDPNEKIVLKEEWMNCPMKDDYSSLFLNPDDRTPGTNFYRKTDKLMRPLAAEVENDYEE